MSDELKRSFRRANRVIVVATLLFVVGVILLRDAGEGVRVALGLTYFFGGLIAFLIIDVRADDRERRNQ